MKDSRYTNHKENSMISKSFVKGFNLPALVGATVGLLMPVLPAVALSPTSNVAETSNSAATEELLIAQGGCPRATTIEAFTTDTYYAYICEDGNGDYFYYGVNRSTGESVNVYGVTFTDSGYYMATTYDDYGNEYTYMVGASLEVYENGEQIWYESTY